MRATLRIASLGLALAVVALASPAWSARVATARVGQHPQYTRVVFELDSQAGYRLERSVGSDGRAVIVVTLAASLAPDAPRKIRSGSSLIESVSLEQPQGRTVATIRLRGPALPVKEMILTNPPRVVLDVVGTDTALAARAGKPKPKPTPVAKTPEPEPAKKPAPVAKTPEPAPAEKPKPVAKAPEPQPAPRAETPAPAPKAEAPEAAPESEAEAAAREAMERRLAAVREAAEQRKEQLEQQRQQELEERKAAQERLAEQRRRQQEEQAAATPPQPASPAAEAAEEGGGSYLIGAVGGLLLFAVVVAIVMIRRRTLPKNLDLTAFSDEEDAGQEPAFGAQAPETEAESSEPLVAAGPSTKPPLSAPGLFEESDADSEKGESEMEPQAQDLPIDRNESFAASAAPSADVSGVIAELERRMAALEAKLQESNAARERLERQVAAQSEELRVQRAAIARTQRALRGLSRSEEEQATEPALRD